MNRLLKLTIVLYANLMILNCLCQNIQFSSQTFKNQLLPAYDTNQDGEISYQEADSITYIGIGGPSITSLDDLIHFKNLDFLYVHGANINSYNFIGNPRLKKVNISFSQLNSLYVQNLDSLERLTLRNNNLHDINVSTNRQLMYLRLSHNPIQQLDISNNINLRFIIVDNTNLTSLDLSKICELLELWTFNTNIGYLDISYFSTIIELFINDMPLLNDICVWPNFDSSSIPAFSDNNSQPNYVECYTPTEECQCTKKANASVVLPNVFTPNDDGFNDEYKTNLYNYSYYNIEIYNRWGHLVFQSDDQNNSWKGIDSPTGNYYAILSYKIDCPNSEIQTLKGFVQLLR